MAMCPQTADRILDKMTKLTVDPLTGGWQRGGQHYSLHLTDSGVPLVADQCINQYKAD